MQVFRIKKKAKEGWNVIIYVFFQIIWDEFESLPAGWFTLVFYEDNNYPPLLGVKRMLTQMFLHWVNTLLFLNRWYSVHTFYLPHKWVIHVLSSMFVWWWIKPNWSPFVFPCIGKKLVETINKDAEKKTSKDDKEGKGSR